MKHELTPEQLKALDEATKAADKNYGLTDEELQVPEPKADPHGMGFSDEELTALTTVDDDESIALAFKSARTPAERALLRPEKGEGSE